jgi:hypothetical protein
MLSTPNLQTIAHQTQELAKNSKDQRLGMVFQTVSMVSMAVLGIGGAIHLLRDMLRNSHPQTDHKNHDHPHTTKPDHRQHARQGNLHEEQPDTSMTRHVRHRSHHGHGRGH